MSKWIDVNKQLPEEGETVNVYTPYDGFLPFFNYENGEWVSQNFRWRGRVTHWMSIPEAPPYDEENK